MKPCKHIQEKLLLYVDTGSEAPELRDHIKNCISCKEELESLLYVKQKLSMLSSTAPSPELWQKIQYALRKEEKEKRKDTRVVWLFTHKLKVTAAAAAVLILTVTSAVHFNKSGEQGLEDYIVQSFEISQDSYSETSSSPFLILAKQVYEEETFLWEGLQLYFLENEKQNKRRQEQ